MVSLPALRPTDPAPVNLMCLPFIRLLQGQYPRHTLVKQSSQPSETAFSAFNPPKHSQSTSDTHRGVYSKSCIHDGNRRCLIWFTAAVVWFSRALLVGSETVAVMQPVL